MIFSIHNVSPDNDNRDARFAEMKKQVESMRGVMNDLTKPGRIDAIVQEAIRPIAAEIALQEKEMKLRDGMQLNSSSQRRSPAANKFLLPKGD